MTEMNTFINGLMNKMTLEEKIGQLNLPVSGILTGDTKNENIINNIRQGKTGALFGVKGAAACRQYQDIAMKESRLKIPLLFGLDVIHGYETIFPIPLALASSWNMDFIEEAARISAMEASADGIGWVFSPMVDVTRDARWGRIAEGAGEDPYLGGEIAKAMIRGYQGKDLSEKYNVMACVKHYALYGAGDGGRDYNTVDMSRQRMMNEYMRPFQAAVEAGAGSFMASFNEFEGIPATANKYLLDDVLRKQWRFDGFVVSDYGGITEMILHGIGDYATVAARALDAGIDMDMVSESFNNTLQQSIAKGIVTEEQVNTACRRILEAKYKLGLFADPYKYCDEKRAKKEIYTKENRHAARRIAAECMVLLKNQRNLLPLNASQKIALIGPLAHSAANMPGMWSFPSDFVKPVTLLDGLKEMANVKYAKGCNLLNDSVYEKKVSKNNLLERNGRSDSEMLEEALAVARQSDVIVAALGETSEMTGEGASRADIVIPEPQKQLLKELLKTGKPVVLALFTGRPLVLTWEDENVPAILNVWFAGSEAGGAIADVLLGNVNPSGKLTASFLYHTGQIPVHYNHKNTGRPVPAGMPYIKYRSNYQDIPNEPLYPFGYGLSYTSFEYDAITLSSKEMYIDGKLTASVTIKNSGERDGAEVVQLYIRDIVATSTRPVKELKAFRKVFLKAGESQKVEFEITVNDLKYYNHQLQYIYEPGEFEIMIGGNSRDVKPAKFTLLAKSSKEVYRNPDLVISKLKDRVWVVETTDMTTMYIIEGDNRAMLIDTGTKCDSLDKVVRKITDKPLDVVITHLHPDHAGNIKYFAGIYLHPADTVMMSEYPYNGKVNYLDDGDVFDLGGVQLEVALMAGHTPGSIVLLNHETGDCFSGDAFGSGQVWMQLEPHVPMTVYLESCKRMEKLMEKDGIQNIWCGHYPYVKNAFGIDYIRKMKGLAQRLANSDERGAVPANISSIHTAGRPMMLADGYVIIVYNSDKIN
jgi:beta-glucosidase